jgi:hypothetical protein
VITACLPALPALWVDISTKVSSSIRRMFSLVSTNDKSMGQSGGGFELGSQSHASTKSLNMHSTAKHEIDLEEGPHDPYKIRITTSIMNVKENR